MKKRILGFILVMMLGVSVCACGKTEDTNADSVETSTELTAEDTQEDTTEAATDDTQEDTTEATADDTQEDTTEATTEESTEISDGEFDMRKFNLSGLYEGDDSVFIITDGGKIFSWSKMAGEEAKIYTVTSVEVETDNFKIFEDSLFDTTYRISGMTSNGDDVILCTDGRDLREYVYDGETGYIFNGFAKHVVEFGELTVESLPSNVTIPTFSDEIEGIELDADLLAEVYGLYYTPEGESSHGDFMNETAFAISEDQYVYEWDDKHELSPDGQWHKYQIVRLSVSEGEGYKHITIDTRYKTYTYSYYEKSNNTELSLYDGFSLVECKKVDELPSNVPALK